MAALKELLLLSGMSGAGRSTALHALEDLGYETIDGLPLDLWGIGHYPHDPVKRASRSGDWIRAKHAWL